MTYHRHRDKCCKDLNHHSNNNNINSNNSIKEECAAAATTTSDEIGGGADITIIYTSKFYFIRVNHYNHIHNNFYSLCYNHFIYTLYSNFIINVTLLLYQVAHSFYFHLPLLFLLSVSPLSIDVSLLSDLIGSL